MPGRTIAAAMTALCAVGLAGALTGCGARSVAAQPAGSVTNPASAAAADPAGAAPNAPADAGVDSDLNTVDSQLSGLDSALAQATASPSDGG